ncbi:MAG: hypothetical protein KatS3mg002_0840 [Candidatus Woesearchaeota archaeon]|nr:MAG: hypothetical protein KatS3mg002_0840 [Candidatus Woesearchaeota archaeon]
MHRLMILILIIWVHSEDQPSEWHVGCENFRSFIEKYQPIIAVSGHIHETFGFEDKIGTWFTY